MTEPTKPLSRVLRAYGVTAAVGLVAALLGRSERTHPGTVIIDAACGPLALEFWVAAALCVAAAALGLLVRRPWSTVLGCAAVAAWVAHGYLTAGLRGT